jgi:competence protein ComEC
LWLDAPVDVVRCREGQRWSWDGVDFVVLHPAGASYGADRVKTNDFSCVLRVASAAGTALLAGDIEARSETALLRRHANLRSDVLVVPHHGSRTSSTPSFVTAAAARVAVFTVGYRNRFGHPRPDVVERYRSTGAALLRTDVTGALTFRFEAASPISIVAERDRQRRYWYDAPGPMADPPPK